MFKAVKDLRIKDPKAVSLINDRARRENRTAHNAAVVTILEALDAKSTPDNTKNNASEQPVKQLENQSA